MAWRNREEWRPPLRWLHGHVVGQSSVVDRLTSETKFNPRPIFLPPPPAWLSTSHRARIAAAGVNHGAEITGGEVH
jgi:hypothetical protein